jgi:hypothetical protein
LQKPEIHDRIRIGHCRLEKTVTIFISYRRQDSAAWSGRLFDALSSRYGAGHVFLDIANITPGADFLSHIGDAVLRSDAVLVVIGPDWVQAEYREGSRRLDDPQDLVRSVLRTALGLRKPLVPVLVGGAAMPMAAGLPDDIASLAGLQGLPLRDPTWNEDIARLITLLEGRATPRWTRWLPWRR